MSVAQAFVGLPIETLILDPIVACAKGQAQLAEVTLDFVNQLAFEPPDPKAKDPNERKTKQLTNKICISIKSLLTQLPVLNCTSTFLTLRDLRSW